VYICPACKAEDVDGKEQCRCGTDLSLLQRLSALADVWFNQALVLHAQGHYGRAVELLSACCVVRPEDAEARIVQAQVLAHLGRWPEAQHAVRIAQEIDPSRPELPALETALAEAMEASSLPASDPEAGTDLREKPPAPSVPSRPRKKKRRSEMKRRKKRHK
jgi:tetratricopeptide (TPR) repeat protein